jgi:hypothetical protein
MNLSQYYRVWQVFFNHLTLSLYSSEFYKEVYERFRGYGIKHFLVCCFLASLLKMMLLFGSFIEFENYLIHNKKSLHSSQYGNILDAIFTQLPELEYDGKNILSNAIQDKEVFYITKAKENILAIDLSVDTLDKINLDKYVNKYFVFVLLTRNTLAIQGPNLYQLIQYNQISSEPNIIDGARLKEMLTNFVTNYRKLFLYVNFPVVLLSVILTAMSENLLLILFACLFIKFNLNKPLSHGIRIVLFAISGLVLINALLMCVGLTIRLADYYSVVTVFLASKGIRLSQRRM